MGSLVLGSWNLRPFGDIHLDAKNRPREPEAFRFMASVLMHFDLVAIQEIEDDLDSVALLHRFLSEYDLVVSDVTGNYERLGFFSKFERVRRTNLAAEIDVPIVRMRSVIQEVTIPAACLEWQWRNRYSPDGEHGECPRCERGRPFKRYGTSQQRQSWTCTACGYHLHPTADTIFHKSSTSLHLWFYAMYLMTSTRCGISARQPERELGGHVQNRLADG